MLMLKADVTLENKPACDQVSIRAYERHTKLTKIKVVSRSPSY